jgi:hypothetical protein
MRLRYFRLQHYPLLTDIGISFSAESPLQRQCQIHFVVGVNGSGKTHLLQAITEAFLALARQKRPHFPVTVIYEIGHNNTHQTCLFDNPKDGGDIGWWKSQLYIPASSRASDWHALVEQVRTGATKLSAAIALYRAMDMTFGPDWAEAALASLPQADTAHKIPL